MKVRSSENAVWARQWTKRGGRLPKWWFKLGFVSQITRFCSENHWIINENVHLTFFFRLFPGDNIILITQLYQPVRGVWRILSPCEAVWLTPRQLPVGQSHLAKHCERAMLWTLGRDSATRYKIPFPVCEKRYNNKRLVLGIFFS